MNGGNAIPQASPHRCRLVEASYLSECQGTSVGNLCYAVLRVMKTT